MSPLQVMFPYLKFKSLSVDSNHNNVLWYPEPSNSSLKVMIYRVKYDQSRYSVNKQVSVIVQDLKSIFRSDTNLSFFIKCLYIIPKNLLIAQSN